MKKEKFNMKNGRKKSANKEGKITKGKREKNRKKEKKLLRNFLHGLTDVAARSRLWFQTRANAD